MNKRIRKAVAAGLGLASSVMAIPSAHAANAVVNWGVLTATAKTGTGTTPQYAWDGWNNANSGWQHNSDWYYFSVSSASQVEIKLTTPLTGFNPAFTLWSGTDRGTGHQYNQAGITPYFEPTGGTGYIGYANAGPTGWTNGFGQTIGTGAGGTVTVAAATASATGLAQLVIDNLGTGNYILALGGSCNTHNASCAANVTNYNVSAKVLGSPVPIPAAVWLFGSALVGLGVFGRRKGK